MIYRHFSVGVQLWLVLGIGAIITCAIPAHAQIVPRFQATDIAMDIKPINPDAFEKVTLSLETFAIDLDTHYISWIVDGNIFVEGYGKKSITTSTKSYGQPTNIEALIKSQDGRIVRKTLTLYPATVDVLWEAVDSYVPPFYEGKALPARGAVLKISALPNLVVGDTALRHNELDYTWTWNYRVKGDASGFNQQFMAIKNPITNREEVISVKTQNTAGTIRGEGSTKINFVEPEIIPYKLKALGEHAPAISANQKVTHTDEKIISFAPFFFSIPPTKSIRDFGYIWKVNSTLVDGTNQNKKNVLLIKDTGSTNVDLIINNPFSDMQSKQGTFMIR